MLPRVVIDTNVLVAGLRSRAGTSFRLLNLIGTGRFDCVLTVPLLLEYEEVLLRESSALQIEQEDLEAVLNYICSVALPQEVFYLWRPAATDPDDDMVIEAAIAGACDYIVTFNTSHLAPAERFGCRVLLPRDFLRQIGVTG